MKYHYIEPEVSGELGDRTVIDNTTHPPVVSKLHYEMSGWLGDIILESFPVFIIEDNAKEKIIDNKLTGVFFEEAEVTKGSTFEDLYPNKILPKFSWLKPTGIAGQDDFGVGADGRLVISDNALTILNNMGIKNAIVEPF